MFRGIFGSGRFESMQSEAEERLPKPKRPEQFADERNRNFDKEDDDVVEAMMEPSGMARWNKIHPATTAKESLRCSSENNNFDALRPEITPPSPRNMPKKCHPD